MMKRLKYLIFLLLFCACSKHSASDGSSSEIRLNSVLTRATAETTSSVDDLTEPLFVFWKASDFEANPQTLTTPFIAQTPSGTIDDYASTRYNTFVKYPDDNELVYASGFWPAPVTSGTGLSFTNADDYTSFDIPEAWVGKKDILIAKPYITGSEGYPFSTPLEFIHAHAQLTIKAKLADDMSKFVKYVSVEFINDSRPERLAWSKADGSYMVTGGRTTSRLVTDYGQTSSNQLSKDRTQTVDNIFIVPTSGSHVTANIKFQMADESTGFDNNAYAEKESGDIDIYFLDSSSNYIDLAAGDSYTLTLEFGVKYINLYGRLKSWEDGGYVTVPIKISTN